MTFDPKDETLPTKEKMMNDVGSSKTFRILANVEEENTIEFMNYIRFVEIREKSELLEIMVKKTKKNEIRDFLKWNIKVFYGNGNKYIQKCCHRGKAL